MPLDNTNTQSTDTTATNAAETAVTTPQTNAQAEVNTSASVSTPPAVTTKADIVAELKRRKAERESNKSESTSPAPAETKIDGSEAATAGAPSTETPASRFDEDTIAMANAYGVDVEQFTDDASARSAVKLIAERYAVERQNETYQEPVEETPVEEIDRSQLDAKTAAYIKKLEAEQARDRERAEAYERQVVEANQNQINQLWADSTRRAIKLVDELAHPSLGVTGKTTPLQNAAREAVFKTAGRLLTGFLREGRDAPPIEVVVRTALELTGIPTKRSTTAVAKTLPPGPTPAATPKQLKLPTKKQPHDPLGIMQDETFRRGIQEIFGSRS